jgi:hypothetical protein
MSTLIDSLASTASGGRNDALNRAAWTLSELAIHNPTSEGADRPTGSSNASSTLDWRAHNVTQNAGSHRSRSSPDSDCSSPRIVVGTRGTHYIL